MYPRTNDGVAKLVVRTNRMFRGLAICLALFLLAPCPLIAATQPLHRAQSPERLQAAFTGLKANPNSRPAQHRYLKAFRALIKNFRRISARAERWRMGMSAIIFSRSLHCRVIM